MPYREVTAWIMAVRTVAIDRLIHEALAAGVDTVVNLGAGLDTRPYRLDLPKALRWIEVDFPHTIRWKDDALAGETPRCSLRRVPLDFSRRDDATRLYAGLGKETSAALVVTEGVIPYLTNEQAGQLAEDLASVPTFRFWIQDYRRSGAGWRHTARLRKALANAPMLFEHSDPLAFFAERGWRVKHDIRALDEGERIGRRFPIPFPFGILVRLLPRARRERFRSGAGYVLLERAS